MKKLMGCLLLFVLVFPAVGILLAQDQPTPPPKVLLVYREFLKPGKSGLAHERTEAAFVNAAMAAKWPQHYLAMDSMTGHPRSLFFFGYASFADLEKDQQASQKNASFSAALDRAGAADGDLLSSQEGAVFVLNEEQSLRAPVEIAKMRYMEIYSFVSKPGHYKEFGELAKLYRAAYEKADPTAHWAMYDMAYGNGSGYHILVVPLKSLAEVDQDFANSKKVMDAMGEDGQKKAAELEAACMQESQTNIFAFNPRESYVSEAWMKADPTFWKTQTKSATKKTEAKTATGQ